MHPADMEEFGGGKSVSVQIKSQIEPTNDAMQHNQSAVNVARTTLGGGSSSGAPPPGGHTRKGTTSSRGSSPKSLSTRMCPTPPSWLTKTRPARPRTRSRTLGGVSALRGRIGSDDDGMEMIFIL